MQTNKISKIGERFVFQDLIKKDEYYMKLFKAQGWTQESFPMRMTKDSIV